MTDAFGERKGLEGAERGIENSREAQSSENYEWGILMIVRRLKRGTLRLRVYLNFSKIGVRLIESSSRLLIIVYTSSLHVYASMQGSWCRHAHTI